MPEKEEVMMGKKQDPPPFPPEQAAKAAKDEFMSDEERDKEARKRSEETVKHKKELLAQARAILREFGGQASNIPITSAYWDMMNEFRAMPPAPLPTTRITEPYRELPVESLYKPDRPGQILRDSQEQLAHYDKQHPPAQAVIQMEIQKENELRMTPEEKADRDKLQKEAEKKLADDAKRQDEINQRFAAEEKRHLEERVKQIEAARAVKP